MAVEERDPHTGYMTTGHEWNGIKELNTPVPRAVCFFLIVTALFAVVYWMLMPAWPLGITYTKGLLGIDQRAIVNESLKQAAIERAPGPSASRMKASRKSRPIRRLMDSVRQTGRTLFGDNCAACHGSRAQGGNGFPNLTTASWLWGGMPKASPRRSASASIPLIRKAGLANDGLRARSVAQEGRNRQRRDLRAQPFRPCCREGRAAAKIEAGKAVFAANCVSCHGDDAQGQHRSRCAGPDRSFWIYGGDAESISTTVWSGRQGHMPTWEDGCRARPQDS